MRCLPKAVRLYRRHPAVVSMSSLQSRINFILTKNKALPAIHHHRVSATSMIRQQSDQGKPANHQSSLPIDPKIAVYVGVEQGLPQPPPNPFSLHYHTLCVPLSGLFSRSIYCSLCVVSFHVLLIHHAPYHHPTILPLARSPLLKPFKFLP